MGSRRYSDTSRSDTKQQGGSGDSTHKGLSKEACGLGKNRSEIKNRAGAENQGLDDDAFRNALATRVKNGRIELTYQHPSLGARSYDLLKSMARLSTDQVEHRPDKVNTAVKEYNDALQKLENHDDTPCFPQELRQGFLNRLDSVVESARLANNQAMKDYGKYGRYQKRQRDESRSEREDGLKNLKDTTNKIKEMGELLSTWHQISKNLRNLTEDMKASFKDLDGKGKQVDLESTNTDIEELPSNWRQIHENLRDLPERIKADLEDATLQISRQAIENEEKQIDLESTNTDIEELSSNWRQIHESSNKFDKNLRDLPEEIKADTVSAVQHLKAAALQVSRRTEQEGLPSLKVIAEMPSLKAITDKIAKIGEASSDWHQITQSFAQFEKAQTELNQQINDGTLHLPPELKVVKAVMTLAERALQFRDNAIKGEEGMLQKLEDTTTQLEQIKEKLNDLHQSCQILDNFTKMFTLAENKSLKVGEALTDKIRTILIKQCQDLLNAYDKNTDNPQRISEYNNEFTDTREWLHERSGELIQSYKNLTGDTIAKVKSEVRPQNYNPAPNEVHNLPTARKYILDAIPTMDGITDQNKEVYTALVKAQHRYEDLFIVLGNEPLPEKYSDRLERELGMRKNEIEFLLKLSKNSWNSMDKTINSDKTITMTNRIRDVSDMIKKCEDFVTNNLPSTDRTSDTDTDDTSSIQKRMQEPDTKADESDTDSD